MTRWAQRLAAFGTGTTLLCGVALDVQAAGFITLAWDPNPEPDIAGYRVYYRESGRSYAVDRSVPVTEGIHATNEVRGTVPGLREGRTYFFVVTAINVALLESDYSSEVSAWIPYDESVPAPRIVSQPVSQVTTNCHSVRFGVSAESQGPAFYQWQFNGQDLAGADEPALAWLEARRWDAGDYRVVVSNAGGAVTSTVARLTVKLLDFGDAPAPYPTVGENAARHFIVPGFHLGAGVDEECDGQADALASGDDRVGWDEDGVSFLGPLLPGQTALIEVVATRQGLVSGWIDFAGDGTWAQADDRILADAALEAGVNRLEFTVPSLALEQPTFARFRFASQPGLTYEGPALDGEVEDYRVMIGAKPALTLGAAAEPSPVGVSSNLSYVLVMTNSGPVPFSAVRLTCELDEKVDFLSALPSQGGCAVSERTITCQLDGLGAGLAARVELEMVPRQPGFVAGKIGLEVEALGGWWASGETNLTTEVRWPPVITAQPRSLELAEGATAILSVAVAEESEPVWYQWRVGDHDLPGATNRTLALEAVQPLDAGVYAVLVTNRVGAVLSERAVLKVGKGEGAGDLAVRQEPLPPWLALGSVITYWLEVTNQGPFEAAEVTLVDALPDTVRLVTVVSTQGSCRNDRGTVSCALGKVAAGASVGVEIAVEALQTGTAVNRARVASSTGDPNLADNVAETATLIEASPELSLGAAEWTVTLGGRATFSAAFAGDGLPSFQWWHEGVPILGATNSWLVLEAVTFADAGTYEVQARNRVGEASRACTLRVEANTPPVITRDGWSHMTIAEDGIMPTRGLTVRDGESTPEDLQLTAWSSDPRLVPDRNILLEGSGTQRGIRIIPAAHRWGTATITVMVRDPAGAEGRTEFLLTVTSLNDRPAISEIPDLVVERNGSLGVPLVVWDDDTPLEQLALSLFSSDPALVPLSGLVLGGTGADRTLRLTPAADRTGRAEITIKATDSEGLWAWRTFSLTVEAVPRAPVIRLEPQSRWVARGERVVLAASAVGTEPLRYQWRFNGRDLAGATGSSLILPEFGPADLGYYEVVVSNPVGSAGSLPALLRLGPSIPPAVRGPVLSPLADLVVDEDTPAIASLTVTDSDTPLFLVGLRARSSNQALLPDANIFFEGAGSSRTMTLVPAADQFGAAVVTVTASDGTAQAGQSFNLTVAPVNDPPTLDPLPHLSLDVGSGDIPVQLTGISRGPTNETSGDLSFQSRETTDKEIVELRARTYSNPDTEGVQKIKAKSVGLATITLTFSDKQPTNNLVSQSFQVFAKDPANSPPTLSPVAEQAIDEDGSVSIPITVADAETSADRLILSARSFDTDLVPAENVVVSGTGPNRTVTVTPSPDRFGRVALSVAAVDEGFGMGQSDFDLTVRPVNDLPTISGMGPAVIDPSGPVVAIPFAVGDVETPADRLTVTAVSSDPTLVPDGSIQLGGSGSARALGLGAAAGRAGRATITVSVSDGGASASTNLVVDVLPANDPPVISDIPDQAVEEDQATSALAFTVSDHTTSGANLALSAASSNPALVPEANIRLGGSGSNRTVRVEPAPDQHGWAAISVLVSDEQGATARDSFILTVRPANDPPGLDPIASLVLTRGAGEQIVALSGIHPGAGEEGQPLTLTARSNDPEVVADPIVTYPGPGGTGSLRLVPLSRRAGVATIVVTANDGQAENNLTIRTFTVTVVEPLVAEVLPRSQTVPEGMTVRFLANAVGGQNLSYRWQKDGEEVPGASSAVLSLASVQAGDAGVYRAVVRDGTGPEAMAEATLRVLVSPVILRVSWKQGLVFHFASVAGLDYALEVKGDLADPAWTVLSRVHGDGSELSLGDWTPQSSAKFYRLRVE